MGAIFGAVQTLWTKPRGDCSGSVIAYRGGLGQLGYVKG
jgi:hypothetical protein